MKLQSNIMVGIPKRGTLKRAIIHSTLIRILFGAFVTLTFFIIAITIFFLLNFFSLARLDLQAYDNLIGHVPKGTVGTKDLGRTNAARIIATIFVAQRNLGNTDSHNMPMVVGNKLVDNHGKPLLLRGAVIDSEFHSGWKNGTTFNTVLNQRAFATMYAWHMNALRLPLNAYDYQKPNFLSSLNNVVQAANQAGLYVILSNYEDSHINPPPYLDKTGLSFLQVLAQQYKNNPLIMFDIINEPSYPSWQTWLNGKDSYIGMNQAIAAIRQAGATQPVIVQPLDNGGAQTGWLGYRESIADHNVIYSLHYYGQVANGNPASWNKEWGGLLGTHPLFVGAWSLAANPPSADICQGVNSENADAITFAFLDYLTSVRASWTAVSFNSDQLIRNDADFSPTNFQTNTPWVCPNGIAAGMGQDVKKFLSKH